MKFIWVSIGALSCAISAYGADSTARYTFSWPLAGSTLKPRGGTTKGVPVTL